VADVLSQTPLNIRFNRAILGDKWDAWVQLVSKLMNVHLSDEPNRFKWRLTTIDSFSVKSMYANIMNEHTIFFKKVFVENKGPTKNLDFYVVFLIKR
jgi:hypothetical protein